MEQLNKQISSFASVISKEEGNSKTYQNTRSLYIAIAEYIAVQKKHADFLDSIGREFTAARGSIGSAL